MSTRAITRLIDSGSNSISVFKSLVRVRSSRSSTPFFKMTNVKVEIVEGVFAVNKPPLLTSADVLRRLNRTFEHSSLFAPLISHLNSQHASSQNRQGRFKKKRRGMTVKMGHGGTLDPLATGILIIGVGAGTKALPRYLGCTKTYETVLLFGVESDSYDIHGRVTKTSTWDQVTKEAIAKELEKFRGTIMQRPPIYSAKWVGGERFYEIARRGGEIPEDALRAREVKVHELEMLEFWPEEEHVYGMQPYERSGNGGSQSQVLQSGRKRKREHQLMNGLKLGLDNGSENTPPPEKHQKRQNDDPFEFPNGDTDDEVMSGALPADDPSQFENAEDFKGKSGLPNIIVNDADGISTPNSTTSQSQTVNGYRYGPAVKLRMTVTSGFYVRSLCHDLAKSLGSTGVMAELVRTRQGEFELGAENVVDMVDFEDAALDKDVSGAGELLQGENIPTGENAEKVWGPKVRGVLEEWQRREREDSS